MDVEGMFRQLVGFRKNRAGELYIPGARAEDYTYLVDTILDELEPVIGESLEAFWWKIHTEYVRYWKRFTEPYNVRPRLGEPLNDRQKLLLLKFYLYRRTYSAYEKKYEGRRDSQWFKHRKNRNTN